MPAFAALASSSRKGVICPITIDMPSCRRAKRLNLAKIQLKLRTCAYDHPSADPGGAKQDYASKQFVRASSAQLSAVALFVERRS